MAQRSQDPARPATQSPGSGAGRSATTHIAAGSRVIGDIKGATDLIVEGLIEGTLDMDSGVVVGASGRVEGRIRARTVRVAGRVNGNVKALEVIEILPEGRVEGDVRSPRVTISKGSFFKGNVEMDSGPDRGEKVG